MHAVLWKRDSRAVIAWVGLAWLAPLSEREDVSESVRERHAIHASTDVAFSRYYALPPGGQGVRAIWPIRFIRVRMSEGMRVGGLRLTIAWGVERGACRRVGVGQEGV